MLPAVFLIKGEEAHENIKIYSYSGHVPLSYVRNFVKELADYEALKKGYRNDVNVSVLNDVYSLHVYSIVRLKQDFETEVEAYGFYCIDPNLVLVNEVCKEEIEIVIFKLYA